MLGGYGFLRRGAVGTSSPSSLFYDLSKGFDFISNFFENGSSYLSFLVSSKVMYSGYPLFMILSIYYYSSSNLRLLAEFGDDSSRFKVGYLATIGSKLGYASYKNFLLEFYGDIDFLIRVLADPSTLLSVFVIRGPLNAGCYLLPLKDGTSFMSSL